MQNLSKHFATRLRRLTTPQSEPIPGTTQVPNSAGGFAWALDKWAQLDRFLILGTEDGTFYVAERQLTRANAQSVVACIGEDGPRVVRRVVEVSGSGRAAKNDPALFVLAMAAGFGDDITRALALTALPNVARTGTHLFHWLEYLASFRGWGRGVRTAVGRWYTQQSPADLAYQLLKYQARDGWSHRDALRLAHPEPPSATHDLLFRFAVKGWDGVMEAKGTNDVEFLERIEAVQALRQMTPRDAARVIRIYRLTREMVPTDLLRHAVVWDALLDRMPIGAMVRSLGVMTKVGLLLPGSDAVQIVVTRLRSVSAIQKARLHPLGLLAALKTYAQGHGVRGAGQWAPVPQIIDALDGAFYAAFASVLPTGKRMMIALDVSGSMGAGVHALPFLSCREASAALALVTVATETHCRVVAFSNGAYRSMHSASGLNSGVTSMSISPRQRLDDVMRSTAAIPFGGTDCALPMVEAMKHRWPVDVFVVYTDNETWAGDIHPAQALRDYREHMGIGARLVVVGMTSNGFSIADPNDAGMLDVVGFDTATPHVISEFSRA
jgi:60 kDa SS-A/Ro ribonucleoprotein